MRKTSRDRPPRRAILLADPQAGYRLARSRGWAGEAAALDAVRLVDTDLASAAVPDLAGYFTLGARSLAVVRGGVVHAPDGTDRYWRETVALELRDFERVRCNPFRILPPISPAFDELGTDLDPPEPLDETTAEQDLDRLRELRDKLATGSEAGAERGREALLAAVLESSHTLVLGSALMYDEIELLLLLLPAPLRVGLTFHSHALSMPAQPVPRLVVAPNADELAFDPESGLWRHRLPHTRASIGPRPLRIASDLLALLETPGRLVDAHIAYEQYAERMPAEPRPPLDEVETLLRFSRMRRCRDAGDAAGALHVVGESLVAHVEPAHPEPQWLFELMRAAFGPDAIGELVVTSLPDGALAATISAYVIEQFALLRQTHAAEFEAFARPIQKSAASLLLVRGDEITQRLRTLLLLLAAARDDAPAMVAALHVPPDAALVDRLGGEDVWAAGDGTVAQALRAFLGTDTTDGITAAITMLEALATELPAGRDRLRVVELSLDYARLGLRRLPGDSWPDALPLVNAAMRLCQAITIRDRVSLDGRPDAQHYHDLLSRAMNPAAQFDFAGYSDADLFFGFLGADAARGRIARREITERGDRLVRGVQQRIESTAEAAGDQDTNEGVHWSLALLERVRRGELDAQYVVLATQLLELSAGGAAGRRLRAYFETEPAIARALLSHLPPGDLVEPTVFKALCTAALSATLDEAGRASDTAEVVSVCQQLRDARMLLDAEDVRRSVEKPLGLLVDVLRNDRLRPVEMHLATLNRALAPVLAPDALAIVRPYLRAQADQATVSTAVARLDPPAPERVPLPARQRKRRRRDMTPAAIVGAAIVGMGAVMLTSESVRRALFVRSTERIGGEPVATAGPSSSIPAVFDPAMRLERARASGRDDRWSDVVELLSGEHLDRSSPHAFAWDSLLATGALREAEGLAPGDDRRRPLLETARDRAHLALEASPVSADASLLLRLIRAEACLIGDLVCENAAMLVDLALAAESEDRAIADRAAELIRSRW